jgi:hypothetical protein
MAVTDIGKETASEMGLSLPDELTAESRGDDLLDLRLRWQELLWRDIQGLCKAKQFEVSDAPDLGFNLRDHIFGDIPAKHPAPGGQHSLGQPQLMAKGLNAGTKDVLLLRHLPNLEVDRSDLFDSIASVFGRFLGFFQTPLNIPRQKSWKKWPLEMRFFRTPRKLWKTTVLAVVEVDKVQKWPEHDRSRRRLPRELPNSTPNPLNEKSDHY